MIPRLSPVMYSARQCIVPAMSVPNIKLSAWNAAHFNRNILTLGSISTPYFAVMQWQNLRKIAPKFPVNPTVWNAAHFHRKILTFRFAASWEFRCHELFIQTFAFEDNFRVAGSNVVKIGEFLTCVPN